MKDWISPIYRDVVQGRGGIAGGRFTFDSNDTLTYDFTAELLATESGIQLTDELAVGLKK